MITVKEADNIIEQNIQMFPAGKIPLQEAYGMILQEDLCADRNFPPFNRATMDGIAINHSSWASGNRVFSVEGMQKSGIPSLTLKDQNACIETMTGAVLPKGCDCVIPVEKISLDNGQARLQDDLKCERMMNVHSEGSDQKQGTVLIEKGTCLMAAQIAVAAAIGKSQLLVSKSPKIAAIGTGDEIVGVDQKPEPFQIRQSNSYAVQCALALNGFKQVTRFHINDDKDELRSQLKDILKTFDVLILSGGVSKGKFDFVPEILEALGVEVLFHKVKQRPGKPFWFGRSKEGKPVFALPGNPVSTQVGTYRYVLPYLYRAVGVEKNLEFAVLDQDVQIDTAFTIFLPVRINCEEEGRLMAVPVIPNSSGDFTSLACADGFIELPADTRQFPKGTTAPLTRW